MLSAYKSNPFTFPGYRLPGIDPAHVATKNKLFFSGVATANGFINLLNGSVGLTSVVSNIDGALGPAPKFTSAGNQVSYTSAQWNSPASVSAITQAAIFRISSTSSYLALMSTINVLGTSANNAQFVYRPGDLTMELGGDFPNYATPTPTFVPALNVPYFAVASSNLTNTNYVFLRLDTGQITTTTSSASLGTITARPNFVVGNTGNSQAATGPVAACMYSGAFLSMPELLAWAADPWAFWYPRTVESLIFNSLAIQAVTQNPFNQNLWEGAAKALPKAIGEATGALPPSAPPSAILWSQSVM